MPDADSDLLALFDHDGVLVDSFDFHQEAWLELGRREKLPLTPEFIHQTFGQTNASIFERLLSGAVSASEVRRLGDLKEACYRDVARDRLVLMDGVRELLDGLIAAGFRLAIGSSGPRANLLLTVERCGLGDHFTAITGSEDIQRGKPDPQVFQIAAERAGVSALRSVVFEDATFGIQAAKAAGMHAVGVGTTHPLAMLQDAGADETVANLVGYSVADLARTLRLREK